MTQKPINVLDFFRFEDSDAYELVHTAPAPFQAMFKLMEEVLDKFHFQMNQDASILTPEHFKNRYGPQGAPIGNLFRREIRADMNSVISSLSAGYAGYWKHYGWSQVFPAHYTTLSKGSDDIWRYGITHAIPKYSSQTTISMADYFRIWLHAYIYRPSRAKIMVKKQTNSSIELHFTTLTNKLDTLCHKLPRKP